MNQQICTECNEPIPTGLAVIRSENFQRVFFHGHCWDLRQVAVRLAPYTVRQAVSA